MSEELKLDKSNWTPVTFGDVVAEVRTSTKDPVADGIERVVGLEHIEPECIHLRNWASIEDETTFTKVFCKGQVLFGRRRAYLKKAALADFDGICSGDITVMKAKDGLTPELLPFLVNNDKFFDYAVQHSAGGLSPRTKFKDIANYEFLLPPKHQQAKLAELLWAADAQEEAFGQQLAVATTLKHAFRKRTFLGTDYSPVSEKTQVPDHWKVAPLKEVCEVRNTLRKPISKEVRASMQGRYPYYGPTSIVDRINEYRVEGTYTLLGEDGDHFLKYATWNMSQLASGQFNVNNHAHLLEGTAECSTTWLYYLFQHKNVISHLAKQGATRYKLNKDSLERIKLLVPPRKEQDDLIAKLDLIEENLEVIKQAMSKAGNLTKSLIRQIF